MRSECAALNRALMSQDCQSEHAELGSLLNQIGSLHFGASETQSASPSSEYILLPSQLDCQEIVNSTKTCHALTSLLQSAFSSLPFEHFLRALEIAKKQSSDSEESYLKAVFDAVSGFE